MKRLLTVFSFILVFTGYLLIPNFSSGQINEQANILPLTIFPAIQDKLVKPGETTRMQIQFKNNNELFVTGQIKVANYIISDKKGTPILIEDELEKPKYAAASWITPSYNEITISPNNYVTVDLFVTVPYDVNTCGRYAIVYFQPSLTELRGPETQTESASAINIKFGGLINFIVQDKQCKEEMQISNFQAPKFIEFGPIKTSFDLLNLGDIHILPIGTLTLVDMFGKTVSTLPLEEQRIFPETAKEYKMSLGSSWMIGRYQINLETVFGSDENEKSATLYVWAFPVRSAIAILLALVIIIILLKNLLRSVSKKEELLKKELEQEHKEVEKLKEELKRKNG